MLSGIGEADHLTDLAIPVRADLPGVGRNLQDHLGVRLLHVSKLPTVTDTLGRLDLAALAAMRAFLAGTGPAAQFPLVGGAFLRTDEALSTPDLQLQFCAGNLLTLSRNPFARAAKDNSRPDAFTVLICQLRPHSRGEVRLRSRDPAEPPMIRPGFLSDPHDLEITRQGVKMTRQILAQPAIAEVSHGECWPGPEIATDTQIDQFIAETGSTVHHPVGTCRMGTDENAVLDEELRVRGVDGLRVADASIMPSLTSGNTNAPAIMIGEKAAELIGGT
jgi:choline dehydrogenase